jgi:hypothetical protein
MFGHWFPWKFLVRRAARAHGIFDPFILLAQLRRFSQPSEIAEPIELLREGIKFHARGLINTKAIQHNLDWVWPYWIEKQFNPRDPSFIPRGFSFTHINLTHRDWTAVGLPNRAIYPIVDPRGLITPLHNGWSLDFWVESEEGRRLLPSRMPTAAQRLELDARLTVVTRLEGEGLALDTRVWMQADGGAPELVIAAAATTPGGGALIASLRPYNPEGVQFIDTIRYEAAERTWQVNGETAIRLSASPDHIVYSNYAEGDVAVRLAAGSAADGVRCPMGMATGAAIFPLDPSGHGQIHLHIPFEDPPAPLEIHSATTAADWSVAVKDTARLEIPDRRMQYLYEASVATLVLLSADDIVPGPFTYRRFWFRDACLMMQALLAIGAIAPCRRALQRFAERQRPTGYFQSQNGEWDSNGQVLWAADRFRQLSGEALDSRLLRSLEKGARWIRRKRLPSAPDAPHAGLLPAGFSAEHFGPNDFYYWDDFWALGGLEALIRTLDRSGSRAAAEPWRALAADLAACILRSIQSIPAHRSRGGIPASPYRRMDAGAVGSLVADYPLQITSPGDARILRTVDYLLEHSFVDGAFFQDMIHSGINAYLTLAIAQTLLRAGDDRYAALVRRVARMASPTGQWPEAIHPATGGGCMGDGQHGWAAAEWVMMLRNLFVREEGHRLIIGSGIFREWLAGSRPLAFGPTPTPHGPVSVRIAPRAGRPRVTIACDSDGENPVFDIALPGHRLVPNAKPHASYDIRP